MINGKLYRNYFSRKLKTDYDFTLLEKLNIVIIMPSNFCPDTIKTIGLISPNYPF